MRGVPLYGVLIGLEIAGTIEAGVAYFPALDEMVAAAEGEGCWWNGRRARVGRDRSAPGDGGLHGYGKLRPVWPWRARERIQATTYYRAGLG